MKKVFLALAVAAMFSFVACNGNSEATDTTATTPEQTEQAVQEPVCDENAECANAEEGAEATATEETTANEQ